MIASSLQPVPGSVRVQPVADRSRLVILLVQLALSAGVVYLFRLEEDRRLLHLLVIVIGGFVVHSLLPKKHRLHWFLVLSLGAIWLVLGPVAASCLIAIAAALLALCHLPVPYAVRVGLVVGAALALGALRTDRIPNPLPSTLWPALAAIFMFRLMIYLYDLRHEKEGASWPMRCAYFFLLPNVYFPLFPVVDYKTFLRTYCVGDERENQQIGMSWIFSGLLHLLLHRLVYLYAVPDPSEIQDIGGAARFAVSSYLLYLRVSGHFHIITGILRLFGFHLPRTHNLYFLAAGFGDLWRRMNIYWKDFMVKIAYNPIFIKLHRKGFAVGIAVATAATFLTTWVLHAYQAFWLRGSPGLRWQDGVFWGLLGLLVTIRSLRELRRGTRPVAQSGPRSFESALLHSAATVGTFLAMALLWSFWTTPSAAEWWSVWQLTGDRPWAGASWVVGSVVAATVVYAAVLYTPARLRLANELYRAAAFRRSAATVSIGLVVTLGVGVLPESNGREGSFRGAIARLRRFELNEADQRRVVRGYYEDLMADAAPTLLELRPDRRYPIGEDLPAFWHDALPRFTFSEDIQALEAPPNLELTVLGVAMEFNEYGMLDRTYSKVKPPDTFRMALLGSSLPMGFGVPATSTFENLVELRLNAAKPAEERRFEILNFGALAAFPIERRLILEKRALAFDPDAVLYVAHHNDAVTSTETLARLAVLDPSEMPYEYLTEILQRARVHPSTNELMARKLSAPFGDELVSWVYQGIVEQCKSRGVVPIWVYLPEVHEGTERKESRLRLGRTAREAGFVVIDLSDVYAGHQVEDLRLALADFHLSAKAHTLVADRLYGELLKLGLGTASRGWSPGPELVGEVRSDPLLGFRYRPNSTLQSIYGSDPDGYYERVVPALDQRWQLRSESPTAASLAVMPDREEALRIEVVAGATAKPWEIQLNQPLLSIENGESYELAFEARAEAPRQLSVGLAEAHEPWQGLGFYNSVALTSDWQSFRFEFAATAQDANARIHFDLGGSDSDVELAGVTLRRQSDGLPIEPDLVSHFVVEYRFNASGCRGGDRPASPGAALRILALGGSRVLGVGVHEQDTLAARLEVILNDDASRRGVGPAEVINCGVAGYGLREQLLYYDIIGPSYRPDVVLLAIAADAVATSGLETSDDRSSSATAILELQRKAADQGARLVLVLLGDSRDPDDADALRRFREAIAASAPGVPLHEVVFLGSHAPDGAGAGVPAGAEPRGPRLALANDAAARQVAHRLQRTELGGAVESRRRAAAAGRDPGRASLPPER